MEFHPYIGPPQISHRSHYQLAYQYDFVFLAFCRMLNGNEMSSTRHSAEDVRRVAHHVREYSVWCLLPSFHAWQLCLGGMGPQGGSNVQLDFANGSLIAVYIQGGACLGLNCWWYCSRSFHTWTPPSSAMTFQGTWQWISLAHLDSIRIVGPTPPTTTIHNELGARHTCVAGPAELYMKPRCIRAITINCTDVPCVGMTRDSNGKHTARML